MNACVDIANVMAEKGWWIDMRNGLDKTWECEFSRPPTPETDPDDIGELRGERLEIIYAAADTLPMAVCEACLRALKLWQGEDKP